MVLLYILLAIVLILFILVTWILLAPFIIFIDTARRVFFIQVKPIFKIAWIIREGKSTLAIQLFFLKWQFNPKSSPKVKPKRARTLRKKKPVNYLKMTKQVPAFMMRIIQSFKIEKAKVTIDTGDAIFNAWLLPVFLALNKPDFTFSINYNGANSIFLIVQNRLMRILLLSLRFYRTSF